jgi:hypothetical protein
MRGALMTAWIARLKTRRPGAIVIFKSAPDADAATGWEQA